jgi:flagellar biogenesis protein FliO
MKTNQMSAKQRYLLLAACVVFGLLLPATFLLPDAEPSAEPARASVPETPPTPADAATAAGSDSNAVAERPAKPLDDSPGYGAMLIKTVLSLAAVCLLAFVALKWGLGRLYGARQDDEAMSVVSRMRLGPKREVLVARIGPKHLILGSTEQQMNVLGELTEAEAHDYFERQDGEVTDG